ncbi:probable very-long-chain enoyl-CoA reductase art-1 isoform X1 [Panulirus ornatus]|uniref:probable very-long-chain enoyl-CoA reductase art-1 isoform X1 n=1 Tax=Panulirus ornatus TaxID=150431 RepID=UPI003A87B7E2
MIDRKRLCWIEKLDIYNAKSGKFATSLYGVLKTTSTILDVKKCVQLHKGVLHPERQEVRLEQKGKGLKDEDTLEKLGIKSEDKLYVKDLGPQIGWKTVFFTEYAGPLAIYLWIYQRPWLFYGDKGSSAPISLCAHIAAGCWTFHYAKRLFETQFVHRFSHGTMPLFNLFKNCTYYWGFTAYVAYHVNHPLFTPPCDIQVYMALAAFLLCEFGNFSIHITLRNLRPPGSKERKIPFPDSNPMTLLFNAVSCPNYTYEFGSWMAFTVMTQCLPGKLSGMFALCGFYQMAVWALGKHRSYKKDFKNYPSRKAILPFLL